MQMRDSDMADLTVEESWCNDRYGFTAFPPFQTERAIFTALRFPVGSEYLETEDE